MDLLGRKARRELLEVRSQFAGALIALIATQTALTRTTNDYRSALLLLRDKSIKITDLEYQLHPPRPAFSNAALYKTEEEEDLDWAVAMEAKTREEAEDILRELEFDHSDVYVDEINDRSSLNY